LRYEPDAYLLEHCLARRRHPGDDLISDLVTAEVGGERLDDEEVVVNFPPSPVVGRTHHDDHAARQHGPLLA
jgi:hypothetical protein